MSTALVLIDIQKDYFPDGRKELVGSIEAAGAAARLLAAFRKASWPVFHIQHISVQPAATFFVPGTVGLDIHSCVTPLPNEPVVVKHYPNSFRETDLLEKIRHADVNSILFCGMMTSMCVDATVRAAFDHGFTCTIAQDACATLDLSFNGEIIPARQVQGAFLAALGAVYAKIRTSDDILEGITAVDIVHKTGRKRSGE
jgi:nicotinamidase-related amidase